MNKIQLSNTLRKIRVAINCFPQATLWIQQSLPARSLAPSQS